MKLPSRTVRLVHREVEGSLLAVQLLLAQGAWALVVVGRQRSAVSSPRQVLRALREEIEETIKAVLGRRRRPSYLERLQAAQRERRKRQSSKVKRPWSGRADHKPPKPPKLRELTAKLKTLQNKKLKIA